MVKRMMLAATAAVLLATTAWATAPADLPDPRASAQSWVLDQAGLIDDATEAAINARVDSLEARCGAQLAVATVDTTDALTPRDFATELFRLWGVGQRSADNGVLVLVVARPHRIEVETGYGAEGALPDGKVGGILDDVVIPRFKEDDYGGGVLAGVEAFAAALEREPVRAAGRKRGTPIEQVLGWVAGGLAAVFAIPFGVIRLMRRRKCPQCRKQMRWVRPQDELPFLSELEVLEEHINSVDHRVWFCDACQLAHIEHAKRIFSGHRDCPQCKRRTLSPKYRTLVMATTSHEGKREVTLTCANGACRYTEVKTETVPRVTASSSGSSSSGGSSRSSGSSFGGGRSGGGGAGRSW